MEPGEARSVDGTDVHVIETGMFDTTGYGGVYVIDRDPPTLVESGIGTDTRAVLDGIDAAGIDPEAVETIALTHVHLDHAGGAGFLADACPDATVYVHEYGARHLIEPDALVEGTKRAVGDQWRHYTRPAPIPDDRIVELRDGDVVPAGGGELHVAHCPGHAPHQVVFEDPSIDAVFTGDAAGIWVPERRQIRETTPPPQFDLEAALADVEQIREFDPERLLFTHFGPGDGRPARMLDRYRERLVGWVEAVRQQRETDDPNGVADHFAREAETTVADVWGSEKAQAEARLNVRGVLRYLENREGAE